MKELKTVQLFETNEGAKIYQLPLQAFPGFWVYAWLVITGEYQVLIDTGSNFGNANSDLDAGFAYIAEQLGRDFSYENLTHIFITHGHIDHFGGLAYVTPKTNAKVCVHELDLRILTNYDERRVVVSRRMRTFLLESGVSEERTASLLNMYQLTKDLFQSVEVDFTYEAEGMQIGPFQFLHTPGHCAGLVCIRLHDILITADHVLSGISPHQAPERLTLSTGLTHYLSSLCVLEKWVDTDVRLSLGSHKRPIENVHVRIQAIRLEHLERLQKIIDLLETPQTIAQISKGLFGTTSGYNVLLALEEAGAHVEYLYQRGLLGIANLDEVKQADHPIAICYEPLVSALDSNSILSC